MTLDVYPLALAATLACFLCNSVTGCENSTTPEAFLEGLHHPTTLNACITELLRAMCNALRPLPIKRNTELINSILGLPRVLQDAGR